MCRFNALDIRRRLNGRRLVFVGDSLCRNQFESALCLLGVDLPDVSAVVERKGNNLTRKVDTMVYDFTEFNFTVEYHLSHFLVGFHRAPPDAPPHIGAVVNTDTVDPLFARRLFDNRPEGMILVLNAGHWFTPSKISRQNVSFLVNNQTRPDIDETEGFRLAMLRVSDWLQEWPPQAANATAVFRTYAPAHFAGGRHGTNYGAAGEGDVDVQTQAFRTHQRSRKRKRSVKRQALAEQAAEKQQRIIDCPKAGDIRSHRAVANPAFHLQM
ncbi:unnamed protein product [Closterium sp. Naga37s-1]|nr:unnamed protein product [Closterium sp. Naga37s-1]